MTSTIESTLGDGRNADRGTARPRCSTNSRPHRFAPGTRPSTKRWATARCSTRSADSIRLPRDSSWRSSALDTAKGGLATTRNDRFGSRSRAASTFTTVTGRLTNRLRKAWQRPGCNSKAITCAPALVRCAVSAPSPAPMSSTSSPGCTSASETMRAAQLSESRCQPHDFWRDGGAGDRPADRRLLPGTVDHHHEDRHPPTIGTAPTGMQRDIGDDDPLQGPGHCCFTPKCKTSVGSRGISVGSRGADVLLVSRHPVPVRGHRAVAEPDPSGSRPEGRDAGGRSPTTTPVLRGWPARR
jgi:hypothetical protein